MTQQTEEIQELDVSVGEPLPPLVPKMVLVKDVSVVEIEHYGPKVVVKVEYDAKVGVIDVSKARYLRDGKLRLAGLWWKKDRDGNVAHGSALGVLLRHYECTSLRDLIGRELETESEAESKYLVLKAY